VSDARILEGTQTLTRGTGVFACPEAGACYAALQSLVDESWVSGDETVVLFNTASGAKYPAN